MRPPLMQPINPCPHGVDLKFARCMQCEDPAFHSAQRPDVNVQTATVGGTPVLTNDRVAGIVSVMKGWLARTASEYSFQHFTLDRDAVQVIVNALAVEPTPKHREPLSAGMMECAGGPETPQAPIARVHVKDGAAVDAGLYAPGLPDGKHDLYCEPVATAPYMAEPPAQLVIDNLRAQEWSMGNGQCPKCEACGPTWLGVGGWGSSVGHERDCKLAATLQAAGADVLMKTNYKRLVNAHGARSFFRWGDPDLTDPATKEIWDKWVPEGWKPKSEVNRRDDL